MTKDRLTNEILKKQFKSNFELAEYAINLARYYIKSGHEVNVQGLLDEISKDPHKFSIEELEKMDKADRETSSNESNE